MSIDELKDGVSDLSSLPVPLYWLLSVVAAVSISFGGIYAKIEVVAADISEIKTAMSEVRTESTSYQSAIAILQANQTRADRDFAQIREMVLTSQFHR
jgi:hypothetical protein